MCNIDNHKWEGAQKDWTLDKMTWWIPSDEYWKHEYEKEGHDPEECHWNEPNDPEWPLIWSQKFTWHPVFLVIS